MRLDDLGNDKKLDEVSLGDYRTKAAKQRALSQMGAMFGRDAEQKAKDLETYRRRDAGLNRVKSRDEAARQAAQKKQMDDNIARLPELRTQYEDMKKKYKSLGGSNWQYADREQNLTSYEREARDMEGSMNNLWRTIQAAERAQRERSVNEMDSQGYRGSRYDDEANQGKEGTGQVAKPADVVKHGADILNRAMDKSHRVQDRKTGKWYDPDEEFDKLKNSPDFIGVMKRMSTREGVAEGLPQTLRKIVPGYAKREIDRKMDAQKFGRTDVDKDANFHRYKKIQDKIKEQGVAEGGKNPHPKTWHDVDKKLGKAVDKMSQAEKVKKGLAHPDTLKKQGVAEDVATTMPMRDAVDYLRKHGADNFKTTSNELHFYKNGKPFSVDLVMNPDTTRSVTISSLNAARRSLTGQGVAEGSTDTVYPNAEVIKSKNGKPVGEIYQDGDGWGCFHYRADRGYDFIDSREEAIEALKDLHQETGRSRPDYTVKGVAEGSRIKTPSGMYRDQHTGVAYSKPTGQDGHDSYMTPAYMLDQYKKRLAQIAAGPYKRPKEVAQLQSRIAKLEKQGVAEDGSAIRRAMEAVDAEQRKAKQVPAEEMPKKTSPVLGKKEKQHPFKGRAVGGSL